ncbi:MAG: 50S ribosomal protein L30 [Candidatus Nezhaarchaeota archaeon]|nr:50S ribosomal protein L30 [Candidatus Nezhaarchaeota archaeon]
MKVYAVIRLRGSVGVPGDVELTLSSLRLTRKNSCTIVEATPSIGGMLEKAAGYVTYGEINEAVLAGLLEKRGRTVGGRKLSSSYLEKLGFGSFKELASALLEGRIKLNEIKGLKPVFRLHPPSKGFKGSMRKMYGQGGELGYRGAAINELISRML